MARIDLLQSRLLDHGIAQAIIMQSRSVYYYAGTGEPCNLWVPSEGNPILFARRCLERVKSESYLGDVREGASFKTIANAAGSVSGKLGIEMDIVPAKLYHALQRTFADCEIVDISHLVLEQRSVKEEVEIEAIRSAAQLYQEAFDAMKKTIRPGMREIDVATAWYTAVRSKGADDWIFQRRWDATLPVDGIVASGSNLWDITGHAMTVTGCGLGAHYPWGAGARVLNEGDTVVVDLGVALNGYVADFARTFTVGPASERLKDFYAALLKVEDAAISQLHAGTKARDVYLAAREAAESAGLGAYFQGYGTTQGSYIGHGIGLEIDEFPTLDDITEYTLENGMVLTIEPKFIIPDFGAVSVEDCFVVTESGPVNLAPVGRELVECY